MSQRRFTTLEYAMPRKAQGIGRGALLCLIAMALMIPGCFWLLLTPTHSGYGEHLNRGIDATHLRGIGLAIMLYATDNHGHYPDKLSLLVPEYYILCGFLVCPSSANTAATTCPTTQATIANIESGGHESYIYLGKGRVMDDDINVIIAYEPLSHHGNSGIHVLYGGGRTDWLTAAQAKRVLNELATGHNSPRDRTTTPR